MNGIMEQDVPRSMERLAPLGMSDEGLLVEYRDNGSRQAFEELVHRYEKELFGYLRNYLGDAEMADDVFQQTFLQVYLKCDQYRAQPAATALALYSCNESSHRLSAAIWTPSDDESRPAFGT